MKYFLYDSDYFYFGMSIRHLRILNGIYFNNYSFLPRSVIKYRDKNNKIKFIKLLRFTVIPNQLIENDRIVASQYVPWFLMALCNIQTCIMVNHSRTFRGGRGQLPPIFQNLGKIIIFWKVTRKYLGKTRIFWAVIS